MPLFIQSLKPKVPYLAVFRLVLRLRLYWLKSEQACEIRQGSSFCYDIFRIQI